MRSDLSIYLLRTSGIVFGDILGPCPNGLVAGVTLEPFTSGDRWRSNAHGRSPCLNHGVSPISGPGAGQMSVAASWLEKSATSDLTVALQIRHF
jgi:hypothetical protein